MVLWPLFTDKLLDEIENPFWVDVLISIKSIMTTIKPKSVENLKGIPLRYNSQLMHGDNRVVWGGDGIYLYGDVLNANLSLMPIEELKQKFHISANFHCQR